MFAVNGAAHRSENISKNAYRNQTLLSLGSSLVILVPWCVILNYGDENQSKGNQRKNLIPQAVCLNQVFDDKFVFGGYLFEAETGGVEIGTIILFAPDTLGVESQVCALTNLGGKRHAKIEHSFGLDRLFTEQHHAFRGYVDEMAHESPRTPLEDAQVIYQVSPS